MRDDRGGPTRRSTPPPGPGVKKVGSDAPAILAVRFDPERRAELEDNAADVGMRVVSVRHLQAACSALLGHSFALVLANGSLPSWDRDVLLEHAARQGTTVTWLDDDDGLDAVIDALREAATARRVRSAGRSTALA